MQVNLYNGLTLAYIGDAVFELYIREEALNKGIVKAKELHKFVTSKVNSVAQAYYIDYLLGNNLLTEEEIKYYLKGRNAKIHTVHKDLATYHKGTGFEALIGYLYLDKQTSRLAELIKIVKELEDESRR